MDMLNGAAGSGDLNLMLDCLESGLKVDARDSDNMTPLMHAARGGHFRCAVALLNQKADLNGATKEGKRAIHFTCEAGQTELLKELIKWGVDVECPDK